MKNELTKEKISSRNFFQYCFLSFVYDNNNNIQKKQLQFTETKKESKKKH